MFMGPRNWFQGINSASLYSLAGRYDNPIPPQFLAPIYFLKIPAQRMILWAPINKQLAECHAKYCTSSDKGGASIKCDTLWLHHRLNMEVDLQSLFGLRVTWCAHLFSLAETPQLPPSPRILTRITRALLVSKDRRHLFATPWVAQC